MATELGKAYVQIIPSAKGISGNIEKELNGAGASGETAGEKSGKGFGAKFLSASSKALQGIGKTVLGATGVAAAAAGKLALTAAQSYGEFEQLRGGAQKIFSGIDYDTIAADANQAYKTLNLSASDYLESINNIGGTFKASMGDAAAYDTAKEGLKAISDYATGTGEDVGNLVDKYKLISRAGTQYQTIADQFSSILPQTSQGFIDQAYAAGFLSKKYESMKDIPIDEYQQALTKMMTKGVAALNLTDNAAEESEKTLTGSIAATKAAWGNLLTAFADPEADLGARLDDFISAGTSALRNAIPVFARALTGIADALPQVVTAITAALPGLVTQVLPALLAAALSIVNALMSSLPTLLPVLLDTAMQMIMYLANALIQMAPQLIPAGFQLIMQLIQGILQNLPQLIVIGLNLITAVLQGLSSSQSIVFGSGAEIIAQLVNGLIQNLPQIIEAGIQLIIQLVVGLISKIDALIEAGGILIEALIRTFLETDWGMVGKKILGAIKNAFLHGKEDIKGAATDLAGTTASAMENISYAAGTQTRKITALGASALQSEMSQMKSAASQTAAAVGRIGSTGTASLRQEMSKLKNEAGEAASAASSAADTANAAFQGMNLQMPAMDMTQFSASMTTAATASSTAFTSFDWAGVGNTAATQITTGMSGSADLTAATQSQVIAIETEFKNGNWTATGNEIASGIASGINSGSGQILAAVNSVVQGVQITPPSIDWNVLTSTSVTLDLGKMLTLDPSGLYSSCSTVAQGAGNAIRAYGWSSVGSAIITRIANGMSSSGAMRAAAQRQAEAVASTIRGYGWAAVGNSVVKQIADAIGSKDNKATIEGVGENIASGIATGIKGSEKPIKEALVKVLSGAVKGVKIALKISSPSKVMADEVGKWIPEGIAVGIRTNADSVAESLKEVTAPLTLSGSAVRTAAYESGRRYAGIRRENASTGSERDGGNDAVRAFKEALSAMRVELNDREVGRFIEQSVVRGFA